MAKELSQLALWMVLFFSFQFVFGLISAILTADQRPAASSGLDALSSILSFCIVYILIKTTSSSLLLLGFWRCFCIAIIPVLGSIWFFSKNYNTLIPSRKYINFSYAKDLLGLGFRFFVIEICSIIIFSTDNIIISQVLGPVNVTPYVIVFSYFNVITMLLAMISMPLWSAYTEAYVKKDYKWIKNTLNKMLLLLIPTSCIVLLMIVLAKPIITRIWIGKDVGIKTLLVFLMGFYVLLQAWNRIYSWFLNGIGELKYTLYAMIAGAIINIPISIFFAKTLSMGISGVILGTIVSLSIFGIIGPFQVYRILNRKEEVSLPG
jgi:O-antigen/teichoic acid export membrane protein